MKVLFFLKSTPLHYQREILKSFCESLKGLSWVRQIVDADVTGSDEYVQCDVAVIFGSWKKAPKKKWKLLMAHHFVKNNVVDRHRGRLIVIETPLLGRKITDRHDYHRVGLGHFMHSLGDFKNENSKPDRFNNLNLKIRPWRKWTPDNHVLIVGQNLFDASLFGIDFTMWVSNTIKHLLKKTNRKIVVRDHPENKEQLKNFIDVKFGYTEQVVYSNSGTIYDDLKNAHCTVSYTSGSSIDSIFEGVPVITCSEYNFLWPISTHTLEDVENPRTGDREQLLYNLAYAQWSVQEIKDGKPWKHLIK